MQITIAYLANTELVYQMWAYVYAGPWIHYANCTKLPKLISTVRKHKVGLCNCGMNYANAGGLIIKVGINYARQGVEENM